MSTPDPHIAQETTETDWTGYYKAPFRATSITRNFTGALLERYLSLGTASGSGASDSSSTHEIIEIGGANSCFYNRLCGALKPSKYTVIDQNQYGLDLFRDEHADEIDAGKAAAIESDVLDSEALKDIPKADIVFSVGLIEHFDQQGTADSIRSHFRLCKPGGLVVMTFPTPTLLYRLTRRVAEITGKWVFHDERALRFPEVLEAADRDGVLIRSQINWPIFLTQGIVAYRTKSKVDQSVDQSKGSA